jgi:hypothetical protein
MEAVIAIIAAAVIVLVIIGAAYVLYAQSKMPGFELKKHEWVCTQYRSLPPTYVQSGNVMVPVGGGSQCAQWTRLGGTP